MKLVVISNSEKETHKIAAQLASKVIKNKSSTVIALEGELGAGKTTFVKGFAGALGIRTKIKSPTFVLMKKYRISPSGYSLVASRYLYHIDCYRVRDHRDLATLDLKMLFKSSDNIVLIEWPERVKRILPKKLIRVHIDHVSENERKVRISNF